MSNTGSGTGGGQGARQATRYPASIDWIGKHDIEVRIVFRSVSALRLVLRRLADEASSLRIGLQSTLGDGEGNNLRVGACPAQNRGCLGFAPREAVEAAGNLLAYPTRWALAPRGEAGAIDFHLDPCDCPMRYGLELCPRLDDVFRLVEEYMETGRMAEWVEWGRLIMGEGMCVAERD